MSLSNDEAFDNEDSDSFHSFNDSEISHRPNLSASWKSSLSSDCDSAADFESEHETSMTMEDEYSNEAQPQTPQVTPTKTLFGMGHDQRSECSSDSSAFDGVSNHNGSRQQMGRFKTLKKPMASQLNRTEEPVPICLRMVPELASKQVPGEELFDLDSPQQSLENFLTTEQQTPAKHKNAFTKIWVDWQQNSNNITRSPLREFSGALDAYFNPDLTKDDTIVQPVAKPAKTIMAPVTNAKPVEEYVSPFKDMRAQAAPPKETSLLDGAKKPIIVPAGFDVSRLVEFKNPNHWAIRKHVRTGDRIF